MSSQLLQLQRRMATAVMEPLTRYESTRKVRRDGVDMASEASEFIKPNISLTSLERLEIYNRQYWFRLYSSLEEDFPGLLAVLGRRTFERVMRCYLDTYPSTSFTLRDLGSKLRMYLSSHEELIGSKGKIALDVASLEWAHIEAYDAATFPAPEPEYFAGITDDSFLRLQPSVRLLELAYPVDDLLISIRQSIGSSDTSSNNASVIRKSSTIRRVGKISSTTLWLAVHRQEFAVYYKRLRLEEYRMLCAIQAGLPLGKVFETAFQGSTMDEASQAELLQEAFHQWAVLGWLCAPE